VSVLQQSQFDVQLWPNPLQHRLGALQAVPEQNTSPQQVLVPVVPSHSSPTLLQRHLPFLHFLLQH
jgi:hypothetical protein